MPLSEQSKNVRLFQKLHSQYREVGKRLDALKEFFRTQSGGEDVAFKYRDTEVVVTNKSRESWDSDALSLKLGEDIGEFKKTSSYQEVTCRKAK